MAGQWIMATEIDVLLGLLFIGWWFIGLKCLSVYNGWSELAKEFGFEGKFKGTILRCQSVGSTGATHIGMNNEGLYMALLFVFRPFHKPLFIPWERITLTKSKAFFYSGYEITVVGYPAAHFFIPSWTYKKLTDRIPSRCKRFANGQ